MVRPSAPMAKELPLVLIACETICEKRGAGLSSGQSLRSFRLAIRADGPLEWDTAEVKCLAKAVAISTLRVRDLDENVMG